MASSDRRCPELVAIRQTSIERAGDQVCEFSVASRQRKRRLIEYSEHNKYVQKDLDGGKVKQTQWGESVIPWFLKGNDSQVTEKKSSDED